jgi:type IV pilus assembly protein PilC
MGDAIESGSNFAEALVQHPRIFDKLYVNMVKAGEVGGVLDKVLVSLAEFMEKVQKIKNKVKSAMTYPIVVLTMALAILTFLMIVIIPKFEKIFADIMQGKPLPALTRAVTVVSKNFVVVGPAMLLVVVAIVVALKFWKKTPKGAYVIDWTKLHMPLFGSLFMKSSIARFTRTLGELMDSGVPVLQALTIVGETSGNAVIETAVHVVHDAVKEGENIAPTLASTGIFPPMVISMVEVGEETGELPNMLRRIADNFEDEVDNAVAGLTSIIEPLLIVFLALIVGVIVISLFLPLVGIIEGLSGS